VLLEVASRVSGSMALYRIAGVNFILLDLFQRCKLKIKIPELCVQQARLERSFDINFLHNLNYSALYIDFDDCLLINGKVNSDIVKLIFQNINRGVKVKLITRHDGDVYQKLSKFRLEKLFDDVIHLNDKKQCKSSFITEKDAILIDDSYAERNRVHAAIGIAVLGPDAVDGLLIKSEI
jgi:hypothetical protein